MDVVTLARLQFAITTIYHFFFVPRTLGLVILVAVMETMAEALWNSEDPASFSIFTIGNLR